MKKPERFLLHPVVFFVRDLFFVCFAPNFSSSSEVEVERIWEEKIANRWYYHGQRCNQRSLFLRGRLNFSSLSQPKPEPEIPRF
ncbi:GSDH domain-containing protein [Psidium guajava]|nr:GSDH domain-containing protein [Psidium guajava]